MERLTAALEVLVQELRAMQQERSMEPAADGSRQPVADTAARAAPGQRKLTPRQVRALRDKHRRGVPVPALMDEYGISRASVFRYLQSELRD